MNDETLSKVAQLVAALARPTMIYRFARSQTAPSGKEHLTPREVGAQKRCEKAAAEIDQVVRDYIEEEKP